MGLAKEVGDRTVVDSKITKITEDFLHLHNLLVTKHLEKLPTLLWAVELMDRPSTEERTEQPITLTRWVDKERDTVSIQVNRTFSEFPRKQQILSVYYIGQLSKEQGFVEPQITFHGSLDLQTRHTILEVLSYSRSRDHVQLMHDLADDGGWNYVRFPLNS